MIPEEQLGSLEGCLVPDYVGTVSDASYPRGPRFIVALLTTDTIFGPFTHYCEGISIYNQGSIQNGGII